jgi:hypothetical protein
MSAAPLNSPFCCMKPEVLKRHQLALDVLYLVLLNDAWRHALLQCIARLILTVPITKDNKRIRHCMQFQQFSSLRSSVQCSLVASAL